MIYALNVLLSLLGTSPTQANTFAISTRIKSIDEAQHTAKPQDDH
jgi:hypothetical protein